MQDCREPGLCGNSVIPSPKPQKVSPPYGRCPSDLWTLCADNRAAVIRVLISQLHLLKDARSEVEQVNLHVAVYGKY